jgi:hypothetical protein
MPSKTEDKCTRRSCVDDIVYLINEVSRLNQQSDTLGKLMSGQSQMIRVITQENHLLKRQMECQTVSSKNSADAAAGLGFLRDLVHQLSQDKKALMEQIANQEVVQALPPPLPSTRCLIGVIWGRVVSYGATMLRESRQMQLLTAFLLMLLVHASMYAS